MKTDAKNATVAALWMIGVLVAATGLGYGIRQLRWSRAALKDLARSEADVQPAESEPEVEPEAEPEPEPEVEVAEIESVESEEPAWEQLEDEPEPEVEPRPEMWPMGPNGSEIWQFFDDLDLNEDEQARLREGFELMRRRFENMSNEERAAEFVRMAEIGERWRNMSDSEREGVRQRMRQRYEEWRRSDSVEIPRLTLD
ncbi:MAG: HMG-box domain-containing protein [Planctomycetota bacterium]|jgi:hypothetical protein